MKRDKNRISLTLKEADEIRECLESLFSMEITNRASKLNIVLSSILISVQNSYVLCRYQRLRV